MKALRTHEVAHCSRKLRDLRNTLVLTESTAKKIFGDENPMGKILVLDNKKSFKVGAVVRDPPGNSTIQFGMVLPFTSFEREMTG